MISRRPLLGAAALGALAGPRSVLAQQYPAKPVRLIVPASTGTQIDTVARVVGEALSKRLNTPVLVDDRAGAGGAIGTAVVAKSPADGYTLLVTGIPLFLTKWTSDQPVGYEPLTDYTPIAMLCSSPSGLVVGADSPYKTVADLVRAMKAKPGEITFSSGGAGGTSHLHMVTFCEATQTTVKHIPYKGNGPATTDVASGVVDFTFQGPAGIMGLVGAGKLRALLVTNRTRWDVLPNVPAAQEVGIAGLDFVSGWIGVVAPARTPQPVVQRLSDEFMRIVRSQEFKDFCTAQQMFVEGADHKQLVADFPKFEEQFKRLGTLARQKG